MHPRDKARLYHDLGQMIRTGISFQNAVQKLARHARGPTAQTLVGLHEALNRGKTIPEALMTQPAIEELEVSFFSACERAGRLETGLELAAEYYGNLAEARGKIWSRMGYPLFILHFAVIAFSVTRSFSKGLEAVGTSVLTGFILLWAGILVVVAAVNFIGRLSRRQVAVDRALAMVPVVGKMRRSFALSRFCSAYDLQLEAGVNVFTALESSVRASGSAMIIEAGERALPSVRGGEQVGTALAGTRAFPAPFIQTFLVGEETGHLPQELRQLSADYRVTGLRGMDWLSEWIPRFLYISILVSIGWQIVSFYMGYMHTIEDITKGRF